nr:transposase [Fodinicola acaciae]
MDVSNWLRPDAVTSADRLFCLTYARGRGQAQMIPGWPYSFMEALESGRSSWCAVPDALRLGPDDDLTEVTAAQLREVVRRLIEVGQWRPGDPPIWIVGDSGNDGARHHLASPGRTVDRPATEPYSASRTRRPGRNPITPPAR